jgi:threonine dehydrogenase-like Zn-dependent dehydrogenase
MRALVYTAPLSVRMEERGRTAPLPGEAEIAVQAAGICGSDISGFLGHSRRRVPPLILGHELVGRTRDGRRVVANPLMSCGRCPACLGGAQNLCASWRLLGLDRTEGCFAEVVALPASQLYEIPDSLTDTQAVTVEPLANIVHLFRLARPEPFFRMGIVGAGAMGALALQVARALAVRDVLVQDVSEVRLETARRMGAALAVNALTEEGLAERARFAGAGLDLVLDAAGSAAARQAAFDLCRPGGLVVLLGMGSEKSEIDFIASIRKEHRVVMSFAYTPPDFARALGLLVGGQIDLTPWSAELPLEQGQSAFDRITQAPGETLKMVLRVNGSF